MNNRGRLTFSQGVDALLKKGSEEAQTQARSAAGDGVTAARYIINPLNTLTDISAINRLQQDIRTKWEAAAKSAAKAHGKDPDGVHAIDNEWDAQRHAEFSAALAKHFGPTYARILMEAWELNPFAHDTPEAHAMDRYNNSVGIDSAMSNRPYSLDNLQLSPSTAAKRPWRR